MRPAFYFELTLSELNTILVKGMDLPEGTTITNAVIEEWPVKKFKISFHSPGQPEFPEGWELIKTTPGIKYNPISCECSGSGEIREIEKEEKESARVLYLENLQY